MATPYKSVYVTLGSLMAGSRAIDCFQHDGLEGTAKRHPGSFVTQAEDGTVARQPILDELEVITEWRINGRYDQDNGPIAKANWVSNYFTLLATAKATLEVNTTQTLTLTHPGGTLSGDCQVVEIRGPSHDDQLREIATLAVVLLLPDGPLT